MSKIKTVYGYIKHKHLFSENNPPYYVGYYVKDNDVLDYYNILEYSTKMYKIIKVFNEVR